MGHKRCFFPSLNSCERVCVCEGGRICKGRVRMQDRGVSSGVCFVSQLYLGGEVHFVRRLFYAVDR